MSRGSQAGLARYTCRVSALCSFAMVQSAATSPASAQSAAPHPVRRTELPLSCPLPSMAVWNEHPRVYLPIVENGGRSKCPYCGSEYVLVE